MRFTRDFLLLVGLCVVVAGIGASSLWLQKIAFTTNGDETITLAPGSAPEVVAEKGLDRTSLIASLRALLPERALAPVADDREEIEAAVPATSTPAIVTGRTVSWCDATVLDAAFSAAWPLTVEVVVEEGARIVRVPGSVSTDPLVPSTPPQAVVQLPLAPGQGGTNCLTHSYVGITPSGRLIHNNDVILYSAAGTAELIGYAFDGNPIFGPDTSAALDTCGGTAEGGTYRYHVRADEPFIVACFAGTPVEPSLVP